MTIRCEMLVSYDEEIITAADGEVTAMVGSALVEWRPVVAKGLSRAAASRALRVAVLREYADRIERGEEP